MRSMQNLTNIIVEGNIGAGKSTFLHMINQALDVKIVYEPHRKWQHVGGTENILEKFYKDTSRWAYTFQTYAFVTRVLEQEEYAREYPDKIHVLERSVYSDRYCFAKNCYEMGTMNALEWKLYQKWFSWLVDSYTHKPTGFIYLRTNPDICYQRLLKRNRSEEVGVSLEYLQSLHAKHEQWLIDKRNISEDIKNIPVLILDCDQDFEYDKIQQERHLERICSFFGVQRLGLQPSSSQQSSIQI